MAHFYNHHQFDSRRNIFVAPSSGGQLSYGQKAVRAIVLVMVFALMAMPLLLDVFR